MTRASRTGRPQLHTPPARNGMTDTRSTGGASASSAPKSTLTDRRSTR